MLFIGLKELLRHKLILICVTQVSSKPSIFLNLFVSSSFFYVATVQNLKICFSLGYHSAHRYNNYIYNYSKKGFNQM